MRQLRPAERSLVFVQSEHAVLVEVGVLEAARHDGQALRFRPRELAIAVGVSQLKGFARLCGGPTVGRQGLCERRLDHGRSAGRDCRGAVCLRERTGHAASGDKGEEQFHRNASSYSKRDSTPSWLRSRSSKGTGKVPRRCASVRESSPSRLMSASMKARAMSTADRGPRGAGAPPIALVPPPPPEGTMNTPAPPPAVIGWATPGS